LSIGTMIFKCNAACQWRDQQRKK